MTASAATCAVLGVWGLFAPRSLMGTYGGKMGSQAEATLALLVRVMGVAVCSSALTGWVLRDHATAKVLGLCSVGWAFPIVPNAMALADNDLGDVGGSAAGHYFNVALCGAFSGLFGYFAANQKS